MAIRFRTCRRRQSHLQSNFTVDCATPHRTGKGKRWLQPSEGAFGDPGLQELQPPLASCRDSLREPEPGPSLSKPVDPSILTGGPSKKSGRFLLRLRNLVLWYCALLTLPPGKRLNEKQIINSHVWPVTCPPHQLARRKKHETENLFVRQRDTPAHESGLQRSPKPCGPIVPFAISCGGLRRRYYL